MTVIQIAAYLSWEESLELEHGGIDDLRVGLADPVSLPSRDRTAWSEH